MVIIYLLLTQNQLTIKIVAKSIYNIFLRLSQDVAETALSNISSPARNNTHVVINIGKLLCQRIHIIQYGDTRDHRNPNINTAKMMLVMAVDFSSIHYLDRIVKGLLR